MQNHATIYIIGAGAIGKALAVFLQHHHKKVILVRGSIDDQPPVTQTIEVKLNPARTICAAVETITVSTLSNPDGLLVFTNKSYGNDHLSKVFSAACHHLPVVILQNGIDIEQPFITRGFQRIYRAVLFATSQPVAANQFRFQPVAASPVGIIRGDTRTQQRIVQDLSSPEFDFIPVQDLQPVIWTKTIVNCVFNSVCPLLETDNGIFHRNADALRMAKEIIAECVSLARMMQVAISFDQVLEKLLLISRSGEGQLISTYQDILHRRATEIDSLNVAVTGIARKFGLENSLVRTTLLGELVKLKAALAREG